MRAGELLLRYQDLDHRARSAASEIERLEARLARDAEADRAAEELSVLDEERQRLAARLREAEHEAEDHRSRMRGRERELMSGRIRNPTELMTLSQEVEHMKSRVAEEEDAELVLMEEMEGLEGRVSAARSRLQAARDRFDAARTGLESQLDALRAERGALEAERDRIWDEVPRPFQTEYRRLRMQPAVAEVRDGKCTACRVAVTTRGMQMLRRDEGLVHCDNCGRLLVAA